MLISIVAGARPNFIKIAPIIEAILLKKNSGIDIHYRLIHTGQHYDSNMSSNFFRQLNIPDPDINLACGSGSQAEQTANIMVRFEAELTNNPSDLVLVVGDVTSTMACSIVAKKLCIEVGHVEAGIRSGDIRMPEEINRIVTDSISDYFFTTSEMANANLIKLGMSKERIFFVGNTMIDTLLKFENQFFKPLVWDNIRLQTNNYFVLTLHRPSNVDNLLSLKLLLNEIIAESNGLPIIFPVHPRTAKSIKEIAIESNNLFFVEPLGYLEFNFLLKNSKAVITDSGGITEEATVLGVPCMTYRDSTERPETCTIGTNELLGTDPKAIAPAMRRLLAGDWKKGEIPPLWDGRSSERIVDVLVSFFSGNNV